MNGPAVLWKRSGGGNAEEGLAEDDDGTVTFESGETTKEPKGIFTSLLLMGDQDKQDAESRIRDFQQETLDFESNQRKRTKTTTDYYPNLREYFAVEKPEEDNSTRVKRRPSRALVPAVAVSAEGFKTDSVGSRVSGSKQGQQRRLWVKDRSSEWWEECSRPDYPDADFKRAFRMSKATFETICEELNSAVAKEDTTLRTAIPVRQRVAVCIWRLATGEPLRLVSRRFGLGISTCHKLVLEVCSAIKDVLMPKYLQWPNDDTLHKIKDEFESISGMPNIIGSMHTTHIPIIAPKISVAAYFNKRHTERNQKTSYSITVQAVVNPKGVFTDVCIGWPGSMSDDQVLEKSLLYQRATNNGGGIRRGMWIVGGRGHPLLDWILVPYTQQNLTWTQHAFNEKMGEVQQVAKEAFGRLKGRWACLQRRTEVKLQDLPTVLGACCVLHNICETNDETVDPGLVVEVVDDEVVPENGIRSASAMKARDVIAHNLLHQGLAGTSFL